MPALLNYTAVTDHYQKSDPKVLKKLLLAPRKVFSGVKVISEADSGHYESQSQKN